MFKMFINGQLYLSGEASIAYLLQASKFAEVCMRIICHGLCYILLTGW